MPEHTDLLQQIFEQYGLLGMLIGFLILGPAFTYFKTRNLEAQVEAKAQDLLNEFARKERQRADRLERRFNSALTQLKKAEDEVERLEAKIAENARELAEMGNLRQQVQRLTQRVNELEAQATAKDARIEELERISGQSELIATAQNTGSSEGVE